MNEETKKQLLNIAKIFASENILSPQDIASVVQGIAAVLKSYKDKTEAINQETKDTLNSILKVVSVEHDKFIKEVKETSQNAKSEATEAMQKSLSESKAVLSEVKEIVKNLSSIKPKDGKDGADGVDGKDADEAKIVKDVLSAIKLPKEETAKTLKSKLESLKDEERLDASAIKNLPTGGRGGSTARNTWQLNDVSKTRPTNGQTLIYDSALGEYVPGTGGSGGADEKVKLNASDPTAGYLDEKLQEGVQAVKFDTTPTGTTPVAGHVEYNQTEDTLDLHTVHNTYQIGQELAPLYKNQTGATIANATPVVSDGALGASGRIKLKKAIADGTQDPNTFLGITTEEIANGDDGKATWYGKVRNIDTTGTPYDETWTEGDELYVSPTTAGYLTNVKPSAPNYEIFVGYVLNVHAVNGTIVIKPSFNPKFQDLSDVNGTPLTTSGQIPVWDNTAEYFDFTKNINDFVPYTGATSDVDLGSNNLKAAIVDTDTIRDLAENEAINVAGKLLRFSGIDSINWELRELSDSLGNPVLAWSSGGVSILTNLVLSTNSITMTGSLATTGARVTKGWFTDLEVTNLPTANGVTIPTISSTDTLSNKTLTAPKFADLGFIADANGNEMVIFDTVASAQNEITIANAASLGTPSITASGGDTNIGISLASKGTGEVKLGSSTSAGVMLAGNQPILDSSSNELIKFSSTASAVNEVTLANAATGNAPSLTATGGDTNIDLNIGAKGTGSVNIRGTSTQAATLALYEDTDDGSNYSAFRGSARSGNIVYTMPTTDPTAGQSLTAGAPSGGVSALSWSTISGGDSFALTSKATTYTNLQHAWISGATWITTTGSINPSYNFNYLQMQTGVGGSGAITISRLAPSSADTSTGTYMFQHSKKLVIGFSGWFGGSISDATIGLSTSAANLLSPSTLGHSAAFTWDGTNLKAVTRNGTTATSTTLTTPPTATSQQNYRIEFDPASAVRFYINNTLYATHTTNLPNTGTVVFGAACVTASRDVYVSAPLVSVEI